MNSPVQAALSNDVPQHDVRVLATRGEDVSILTECKRRHRIAMTIESAKELLVGRLP